MASTKRFMRAIVTIFRSVVQSPARLIRLPREIFGYLMDLRKFSRQSSWEIEAQPILFQKNAPSSFDAHYAYQAYWAMKNIRRSGACSHVDFSSNIPFVVALSSVVPVIYYELNPPKNLSTPGLHAMRADLLDLPMASASLESISCLHVLEHVGLGRYGDKVDAGGFDRAAREIVRVAKPGANVFISVPVGRERVCFNAHRVFNPKSVLYTFHGLDLHQFSTVTDDGQYFERVGTGMVSKEEYALGLFWFKKPLEQS